MVHSRSPVTKSRDPHFALRQAHTSSHSLSPQSNPHGFRTRQNSTGVSYWNTVWALQASPNCSKAGKSAPDPTLRDRHLLSRTRTAGGQAGRLRCQGGREFAGEMQGWRRSGKGSLRFAWQCKFLYCCSLHSYTETSFPGLPELSD